jgi:hypothetical protein
MSESLALIPNTTKKDFKNNNQKAEGRRRLTS